MTIVSDLFEAIVEFPNDIAPRLAYAATVGGERGELITLQLGVVNALSHRRPAHEIVRVNQLLSDKARRAKWAEPLATGAKLRNFYRGFVEHVEVDASWFSLHWRALLVTAPIRHIDVSGLTDEATSRKFFSCEGLSQIVGLALKTGFNPTALTEVSQAQGLDALRYLWIAAGDISDDELGGILRTLPDLKMFDCADFNETIESDWDGSNVNVTAPQRLTEFEQKHGTHQALHALRRNSNAARLLY